MEDEAAPNVLKCEASELANYLLKSRFKDDSMATASFLLEGTSSLPNPEAISAMLLGGAKQQATEQEEVSDVVFHYGNAVTKPFEVSLTTPRGKFECAVYEQGIHMQNAKGESILIPQKAVDRMILFPTPQDCRLPHEKVKYMVLLCFTNDQENIVMLRKKTLSSITFQLPGKSPTLVSSDDAEPDLNEILASTFDLDPQNNIFRIYNPKVPKANRTGYSFKSHSQDGTSTTTGGMPFVQCYKGVQDGHLYPMKEGLLFFKPPLFLPRSTMHSIACGRGSGGSRYVDLVVTLEDEHDSQKKLEFTNIHRDELHPLKGYIEKVLIPAMKQDAGGDEDSADAATVDTSGTDSAYSPSSRRSQRKASRTSREATRAELSPSQDGGTSEDDEEEEDFSENEEDYSVSDGDMSLEGVNEIPVSDSEHDEETSQRERKSTTSNIELVRDDSSTESDSYDESSSEPRKKARLK